MPVREQMNSTRKFGGRLLIILVLAALFAAVAWAQTNKAKPPQLINVTESEQYILSLSSAQLTAMTKADLEGVLEKIRVELAKEDKELAGLPGPQYDEKRKIIEKRKSMIADKKADVIKEIDRKTHLSQQYESEIGQIRQKYYGRLNEIEQKKAADRAQLIARFEKVLADNPDMEQTPDIMFKLARLYVDKANYDYLSAMRTYDEQSERLAKGEIKVVPIEPTKDYSRPIQLYQDILTKFKTFQYIDGTMYLLGYCLMDGGHPEQANAMYQQMIDRFPNSPYIMDTQVRIGEYYFNNGEYDKALERYAKVLKDPNNSFYDKAL